MLTSAQAARELDHRANDGISVTLLWNAETNRVFVSAVDDRSGVAIQFEVAAGAALDAFRHPYAYAEREEGDDALAA